MSRILSLAGDREGALEAAAKVIGEGALVVFPTDTVYGVGGDAFNQFATARIFDVKARPRTMPLTRSHTMRGRRPANSSEG